MKPPVALPYRRASPSRVSTRWALRPATQADLIPDWDPNTSIAVSVDANIDIQGVLADTDLPPEAPLAVSLTWSSPATNASGLLRTTALIRQGLEAELDRFTVWPE